MEAAATSSSSNPFKVALRSSGCRRLLSSPPPCFLFIAAAAARREFCSVAPRTIFEFTLFLYVVSVWFASLYIYQTLYRSEHLGATVLITHQVSPSAERVCSTAGQTTKVDLRMGRSIASTSMAG